jgi:uncharacterized protein with FMN-binding domain
MLRVLLAIGGTIAGLVALLSFKSHDATGLPSVVANTGSAPASSPSAGSRPAASGPASVLTGKVVQTKWGPMQVQVTLAGHKIVKVAVLERTGPAPYSSVVDARAIPQLNRETLAAQSARIDAVSGASYTSAGYIQSLQSALDKA